MKNWSKTEILILLLLVLPFGYLAFTWNNFPERVPIHFNAKGEPDNYGPKGFGLLFIPVINIFLYLLLKYIPKIDPKKENYALFKGRYKAIRLIIHAFLVFLFYLIISAILKTTILQPKLLLIGMAILFMVLGNYLNAVKPNYFVGIRTPWTLSNEEVWKKTHRLTGKLWVGASILLVGIILLADKPNLFYFIIYVAIITIIPIIYSYILYQKLSKNNKTI